MIILISGVPGAGKTYISSKIREFFEKRGVEVKIVNLSEFSKSKKEYIIEEDPLRNTVVVDEDKVLRDLETLAKEFIDIKEKILIVEGHFAHLFNPNLTDVLIILKTDPNVLYNRLKDRNYDFYKIFENIWVENLEIIEEEAKEIGHKNILTIDTSNSLEKAVDNIINFLSNFLKNNTKI